MRYTRKLDPTYLLSLGKKRVMSAFVLVGVAAVVIVAIVVVLILCCCCCCKSTGKHSSRVLPDGGGAEFCDGFELAQPRSKERVPPSLYSTPYSDSRPCRIDSDRHIRHTRSTVPVFYINQERSLTPLPDNFHSFIVNTVIPSFNDQRTTAFQFAVVLLLSENDCSNINQMTFVPSDALGRPILNKYHPSMPQDVASYGNYIVARPSSNNCHSEEEIFGKYSSIDSPFSLLWSTYVKHNRASPKCILFYTWNLPCSRCTDVVIRSLDDNQYRSTSVIVAHTIHWRSEGEDEHRMNKEKLNKRNITVEQVKYPVYLSPA